MGKGTAADAELSDWETMMNANCMGAFRMVRRISLPPMLPHATADPRQFPAGPPSRFSVATRQ